jgi:GT2 family glycosyltransferase
MTKEVDVIILSKASSEHLRNITENAIRSLLGSEDPKKIFLNILVVESEKDAPVYHFPQTKTIYPKTKFGYHKYMNIGIKQSASPYVCIANNDLIFNKGWATSILNAFDADPDLESASPLCPVHHPTLDIHPQSGIRKGHEVRYEVAGWCIFFKRSILKKIGMLDEKFVFWYADNDYANTLIKYGIQHALVTDSIVEHLESKTLQTKDEKAQILLTKGERFYYEYKWGARSWFSYINYERKKIFNNAKTN